MQSNNGNFKMEMKNFSLICFFICLKEIVAFPVNSDPNIVLVPISLVNQQPRGPFDFIGNWIQSSNIFPLEVNVPDAFSAVGNTVGGWANNVGNFAQNVGSSFQGFTQNVGSGIQNFAQGLAQRVPFLAAIIRPSGPNGQRYVILIPAQNLNTNQIIHNDKFRDKTYFNPELMEIFP